jgi:phosphatidylserine/phosphatidylglycerophosphate/cardiolipin synthase-like enzyme
LKRVLPVLIAAIFFASSGAWCGDFAMVRAKLLQNREYSNALLQGIRDARSSIRISCYIFKMTDSAGNLPRLVAEELVNARRRGVNISVKLEQSSDAKDSLNSDNHSTAAYLIRNDITVRFDPIRKTSHAKIVVIDNRYVYIGSHNLTQSSLIRNNELSVLFDSPEQARKVIEFMDNI